MEIRTALGLLALRDSKAKVRNILDNTLVTASAEFIYLAVTPGEYGPTQVEVSTHAEPEGSLPLQWRGAIATPSGIVQLDDLAGDMSKHTIWSAPCGPVVGVTVYADRSNFAKQLRIELHLHDRENKLPRFVGATTMDALHTGRDLYLDTTRSFGWGGVEVAARDTLDIAHSDGETFAATPHCLRIGVRHRDDPEEGAEWPAQVRIRVARGPADWPFEHECTIRTPSGQVSVGDADTSELVDVSLRSVRVQVAVDVLEDPTDVIVWLSDPDSVRLEDRASQG